MSPLQGLLAINAVSLLPKFQPLQGLHLINAVASLPKFQPLQGYSVLIIIKLVVQLKIFCGSPVGAIISNNLNHKIQTGIFHHILH